MQDEKEEKEVTSPPDRFVGRDLLELHGYCVKEGVYVQS